uniref:Uncharacterized protein n=1 Tax=Peromyscus maniculatus bairdii TaxID=230844 RepID=A0A8C8UKU5_PERMB
MSAHLQWLEVWKYSSFLTVRSKKTYSIEPHNLKACNSFPYSRCFNTAVGVEPATHMKISHFLPCGPPSRSMPGPHSAASPDTVACIRHPRALP